MSIAGLLFGLGVLLIAVVWIGRPFINRSSLPVPDEVLQKQRERMLMVYERVLTNMRDLDEDHSTGKMPDGDYAEERELWVQRGIQVLKALDDLDAQHIITLAVDAETIDEAIDRQIEAAVAAYRAKL